MNQTIRYDILMEARSHWDRMARFRSDRRRNKRYTYGDQWKDTIKVDGKVMTEEEYIASQGNIPLKNNLIRRLVSSVLGIWHRQYSPPVCRASDLRDRPLEKTVNILMEHNGHVNRIRELYSRSMEEFVISGLVVHRKWYGRRGGEKECHTDIVQPDNFFIDSNMRDCRGLDCTCIGEIHDITLREMFGQFAANLADYSRLREIYSATHSLESLSSTGASFGYDMAGCADFLHTSDPGRCRVIEVWRKESRERYRCHDRLTGELYLIEAADYDNHVTTENERRLSLASQKGVSPEGTALIEAAWTLDTSWHYYFLSPLGHVLSCGETPYAHRSHPYVYKAYPFVDGEIHSLVSDVIDQQRYTNRLITMYDWIMRSSAKGLLLFPENCLPDGMSIEDIADQWSRYNGIVFFKAKAGVPIPQQVTNNATNIGITELLNLQLKFFEDISGVNDALQGKLGFAGQSAALFSQQTQNATASLLDLLACFAGFVKEGARIDMSNIIQYYTPGQIASITGNMPSTPLSEAHFNIADMDPAQQASSTTATRQTSLINHNSQKETER